MGVQTAVSVIIGAELGGSFKGAFGSADKQLSTLGKAIKSLNTASQNATSYKTLGRETITAKREWKSAEKQVSALAKAMRETEKPTKAMRSEFKKAQKEASLSKKTYTEKHKALGDLSKTMRDAGIDTKNLTAEQKNMGKALESLQKRQTDLAKIQARKQGNLANRANYRSQIMDVVALGASMYGLVKPAIAFESAMADVKKVVDFESPQELRQMENDIKRLSREIPLSLDGLAQIVAAGGQLGVPRDKLADFAETAAKMSVAFDISADEAGQAMAKLSNVLQMPIHEMGRIGDVINHLSNNIAATAQEIVEVNLRAGAMGKSFGLAYNEVSALAGTFVAMGKSPEIAGTAINMMSSRLKLLPVSSGAARKAFNQLGISMKDYTRMVESGSGKDALMAVLEALNKVQGVKRSQIMKDIFGEQATRHVNSLVEGLDSLKSNFELVTDETNIAGSMQKEFAARSATTENNLQLLKNQIAILATNIGNTLLPTINSVVNIFGKAASSIADFAEKHPTLIKYLGLTVTGMVSMKLAGFALGYGFTFLKGGVLTIIQVFTQLRTVFTLAKVGIGALAPVLRLLNAAFISSPIGLIIAGVAVGAALVIKYWKPISAFFKKLFEPVIVVFKQVWTWVTNLWEKAKNIFNGIKEWISDSWVGRAFNWAFGSDDEKQANNKTSPVLGSTLAVDYMTPANQSFTELPRSNLSTLNQSSVSVNAPITINQAPGMSAIDVANQVTAEFDSREQTAMRRQRAVNYD